MENREYELTLLLPEETSEKQAKETVENLLKKSGGELVDFSFWGVKDLTYPIKKKNKAAYAFSVVGLAGGQAMELENRVRLNEEIIRHLLVSKA